ncbi:tetratricopeptide repeat protein [Sphaerisporangium sp. NPDC004334]
MRTSAAADGVPLPDPGEARSLDELIERVQRLKIWAGNPSYNVIKDRINAAWLAAGRPSGELARRSTIADCFRPGRRRVNEDLLIAVVQALHDDAGYLAQWRQVLRVIHGETQAARQVRVQGTLPGSVSGFIGRSSEIDRLRRSLRQGEDAGATSVVSAIQGMAGVGKTQLALQVGRVLAADEPFDHVLFVDLRGFHPDPAQPPAEPDAVLDGFLRLLGMPATLIPPRLADRAAAYRRRLAGTRTLVVLDNAATEQQVEPLLPDDPRCVALVTSRRSLTTLPGSTQVTLDVFAPGEAQDYLVSAVPGVAMGDDPAALERVARRCGHLPLALALLAGHMRAKADWTVTDHADRLEARHRHNRLDTGVEMALRLSYQGLSPDRQRLLRLLAVHPGQDFDAYAAAALTDHDVRTTGRRLHELCGDHLLQQSVPGRFIFHDLVRAYAADRADEEDRPAARRAALTRLFDYHLFTASAAMDLLIPAEQHSRPRVPPSVMSVPPLEDLAAARGWLDDERSNLIAAAGHAAAHGWPAHATRIATTLFRYLDAGSHYADSVAAHTHARDAAHSSGDRAAEVHALTYLGIGYLRQGRHSQAAEHLRRSLGLAREIDDPAGEARALGNLGVVAERSGRYREAIDFHQQAQSLFGRIGNRIGEIRALGNLGVVAERLGHYEQSLEYQQRALTVARELGDRIGEVHALDELGYVHQRLGRYQRAVDHHRQALAVARQIAARSGEAAALNNLGAAYRRQGHLDKSVDHLHRSLALWHEIGNPMGEIDVRNDLGETHLAGGRPEQARHQHILALDLAGQLGDRYQQARAHNGLAHARKADGDIDQARHHWRQALAIYQALDVPEADEVAAHLKGLAGTV